MSGRWPVWHGRATFPQMTDDSIQVRAQGWNYVLEPKVDFRWAPILRSWFPEDGDVSVDWTWRFLQFVFPLDDPREFPALQDPEWSPDERSLLNRYLSHAKDLAGTTLLTARNGYTVSIPSPQSQPEITETVSERDATIGFLAMLRQFYAADEEASFKRAHDLVGREAHREGLAPDVLKSWRRANAVLRRTHLDHLILVQAAANKLIPPTVVEGNGHEPDRIAPPEQMLSAVFYGDAIHWGNSRTVIDSWNRDDPIIAAKRRFDSLRAAVHFGHLYIGFAGVVGRATDSLSVGDLDDIAPRS